MTEDGEAMIAAIVTDAEPVADEPVDLHEAGLSQRDALLEICDAADIWRSPDGETYVTVPVGGHHEHHALASRATRDWMVGQLAKRFTNKGRPASTGENTIRDVRIGLEARAHHSGRQETVSLRIVEDHGSIYLDLGTRDWDCVEISGGGWRVMPKAPLPIVRSRRTAAFPHPAARGDFAPLRRLLERLPEDDFILLVAWCLGALLPNGPYPILILGGEAGSGKSTLARLAQRLTDPVTGDLLQPPGDDRDLVAAARHNRTLAFDNFSGIRADLADSLCRLATGSEIGGRALYSNHDTASFSACRPLILNGIPDLAARGDLADRSIVLRLDAPASRMTERDWAKAVDEALPRAFAAFLDAAACGLARLDQTVAPDARMADFARFVVAAEPLLPWSSGRFLAAYQQNRRGALAGLVEGDPVARAVLQFSDEHPDGWTGLVSVLHERLTVDVPIEVRRSGDWPGNARWFSDRLRRAAPALRALGVEITERRDGHGIKVNIGKIATLATLATSEAAAIPDGNVASVANVAISPSLTLSHAAARAAPAIDEMAASGGLGPPSTDQQAAFDERAGILEYDEGLTREAAERLAREEDGRRNEPNGRSGGT